MSDHPSRALLLSVFVLLVFLWGSTWLVVKIGVEAYPPFFSITVRFLLAGLLFLGLMKLRGIPIPLDASLQPFFIIIGVLSFTVSYGVVYWGEQYVSSGLAAVIFGLFPVLTGLLAHRFLEHERIGWKKLLGLVVSLAGIVVINRSDLAQFHPKAPLAAMLMILSPAASAVAAVLSKPRATQIHPFALSAVPMLYAGALNLVLYLLFERHVPLGWSTPGVLSILYLSIIGTMITFGCYFWLLRHWEVSKIALIAYLTPIVALTLGVVAGGEVVTPAILGGAALVLGGVAVVGRS